MGWGAAEIEGEGVDPSEEIDGSALTVARGVGVGALSDWPPPFITSAREGITWTRTRLKRAAAATRLTMIDRDELMAQA